MISNYFSGRDGGASVFKPNSLFSLGRLKKQAQVRKKVAVANMFFEVNYRKEEAKILDSVMGSTVYDSRIRPSGINGTGDSLF